LEGVGLVAVLGPDESAGWAVARVIRSAGFDVAVFVSAEHFIRSHQMPCAACLIVDVQLQGMTGLQLQSHLAAAGRHIPMIFITTSADESARALAIELGAVKFLDKPYGDKALLKEISLILKPRDQERRTSLEKPGS